jgi:hypothetical protein
MPYTIIREGEQFCVHKREGERAGKRIACHDTREKAQRQIAALEASETKESLVFLFKEDGRRRMFLISSNAYRDKEDEIVREKALRQYVDNFQPGGELQFWHGGDAIGQVVEAKMFGPFLVEIAEELPNKEIDLSRPGEPSYPTTIKQVWDAIEKSDIEWGASIGFKFQKGDEQDKEYEEILIFERSILPRAAAANAVTLSKVLKE